MISFTKHSRLYTLTNSRGLEKDLEKDQKRLEICQIFLALKKKVKGDGDDVGGVSYSKIF